MAIDASRYALITEEYRYTVVQVAGVAAIYAKAKELELNTKFRNLSSTIANALAAIIGVPKRRVEVTISDTTSLSPDMFTAVTPTLTLVIPELSINGLFCVTRMVVDHERGATVFEAWG